MADMEIHRPQEFSAPRDEISRPADDIHRLAEVARPTEEIAPPAPEIANAGAGRKKKKSDLRRQLKTAMAVTTAAVVAVSGFSQELGVRLGKQRGYSYEPSAEVVAYLDEMTEAMSADDYNAMSALMSDSRRLQLHAEVLEQETLHGHSPKIYYMDNTPQLGRTYVYFYYQDGTIFSSIYIAEQANGKEDNFYLTYASELTLEETGCQEFFDFSKKLYEWNVANNPEHYGDYTLEEYIAHHFNTYLNGGAMVHYVPFLTEYYRIPREDGHYRTYTALPVGQSVRVFADFGATESQRETYFKWLADNKNISSDKYAYGYYDNWNYCKTTYLSADEFSVERQQINYSVDADNVSDYTFYTDRLENGIIQTTYRYSPYAEAYDTTYRRLENGELVYLNENGEPTGQSHEVNADSYEEYFGEYFSSYDIIFLKP